MLVVSLGDFHNNNTKVNGNMAINKLKILCYNGGYIKFYKYKYSSI